MDALVGKSSHSLQARPYKATHYRRLCMGEQGRGRGSVYGNNQQGELYELDHASTPSHAFDTAHLPNDVQEKRLGGGRGEPCPMDEASLPLFATSVGEEQEMEQHHGGVRV